MADETTISRGFSVAMRHLQWGQIGRAVLPQASKDGGCHAGWRIGVVSRSPLIFQPFFKDSRRAPKDFPRISKGVRKSAKDSPEIFKDSKDFTFARRTRMTEGSQPGRAKSGTSRKVAKACGNRLSRSNRDRPAPSRK